MRKGLTPVVATVLLMTVAVASAGTVYTIVQERIDEGKRGVDNDLDLNQDSLRVQHCYQTNGDTIIDVRNTGTKAINASKITPLLNGSITSEYNIKAEIVDSQNFFSINFTNQEFGSETSIILTDGETKIRHTCVGLE